MRRPVGGRGPQLEVRVMWAGQWGAQQVQWIRISQLNGTAKRTARHMEASRLPRRTTTGAAKSTDDAGPAGGDMGDGERPRKSPRLAGDAAVSGLVDSEQRKRRRTDTGRRLRKRRATEGRVPSGGTPGDSRVERRGDWDGQVGAERSKGAPRVSAGVRRSSRLSACGLRPG